MFGTTVSEIVASLSKLTQECMRLVENLCAGLYYWTVYRPRLSVNRPM